MSKHGTALSVGQFAEFSAAVIKALPREIDSDIALNWANNGAALKKVLAQVLCPPVEEISSRLLKYETTLPVPGVERFVAKDFFKKDTSKKAKVKIAWMSENFLTNFVPKVEENVPAGNVRVHTLLKSSLDAPIMKELGGNETYLDDLLALLEAQPNGEAGSLLVNGYANIFYIAGKDGSTWAVDAYWHSGNVGWYLGASPVSYPGRWDGGRRVVSR